MTTEAQILIEKYNQGILSETEEVRLEELIEAGIVPLEMLEDIQELGEKLTYLFSDSLSREMRQDFYQMLQAEQHRMARSNFNWLDQIIHFFQAQRSSLAFGLAFLAIGLFFGLNFQSQQSGNSELAQLSNDLQDMREMMMLTLLEKQSTSDRLKAVSMTHEMEDVSDQVASALLQTLNEDPNVNVRLSAIEALFPYASNPKVRSGLIQSIRKQDSPLVQVALAEVMEALSEKNAVDPLKEILEKERTPKEVKEKIENSISTLL